MMVSIPLLTNAQIMVYAFIGILLVGLGVFVFLMVASVKDHKRYHKTALPSLEAEEVVEIEESAFDLDDSDDVDVSASAFALQDKDGNGYTFDLNGSDDKSQPSFLETEAAPPEKEKKSLFGGKKAKAEKPEKKKAPKRKKPNKKEFEQKEFDLLFDVDSTLEKTGLVAPAPVEESAPAEKPTGMFKRGIKKNAPLEAQQSEPSSFFMEDDDDEDEIGPRKRALESESPSAEATPSAPSWASSTAITDTTANKPNKQAIRPPLPSALGEKGQMSKLPPPKHILPEDEDDDYTPVIGANSVFGESALKDFELKESSTVREAPKSGVDKSRIKLPTTNEEVVTKDEAPQAYVPRRKRVD